jgi:hypothetical protein
MKSYSIPELKITIQAKDDQEFQEKRQKILDRNIQYQTAIIKNFE